MKKQNLIMPFLVLILYSCKKELSREGSNTNNNTSSQVDVYVAGVDSLFDWSIFFYSTHGIPVYWKNGNPVFCRPEPAGYFGGGGGTATAIAVSGNDVYLTGYAYYCGARSCHDRGQFWKNGI